MTTIVVNSGETVNAADLDTANGTNYIINGTVVGDLSVLGGSRVEVGNGGVIDGQLSFGDGDNELVVDGGTIGESSFATYRAIGYRSITMGNGNATVSINNAEINGSFKIGASLLPAGGTETLDFDATNSVFNNGDASSDFGIPGDILFSNVDITGTSTGSRVTVTHVRDLGGPDESRPQSTFTMEDLRLSQTRFVSGTKGGSMLLGDVDRLNVIGTNQSGTISMGGSTAFDPHTVVIAEGATWGRIRQTEGLPPAETNIEYIFQGVPGEPNAIDGGQFLQIEGDAAQNDTSDLDSVNLASLEAGVDYRFRSIDDPSVTSNTISGLPTYPNGIRFRIEFLDGAGNVIRTVNAIAFEGETICFVSGTLIETQFGEVAVEALRVGDMVKTLDHGYQEIRWIGASRRNKTSLDRNPKLKPICIKAGALGNNMPKADLYVSRQHRLLISSSIAEELFGTSEILVPAVKLTALDGVDIVEGYDSPGGVTYWHVMLDNHEVLVANGALAESLLPAAQSWKALSEEARDELQELFPWFGEEKFEVEPARKIVERGRDVKPLLSAHRRLNEPAVNGGVKPAL